MSETIKISCPACGSTSSRKEGLSDFVCHYCGTQFRVEHKNGGISLSPIMESMQTLQTGMDRTATELTVKRLKEEIIVLKGNTSVLMSKYDLVKSLAPNSNFVHIFKKSWWLFIIIFFAIIIFFIVKDFPAGAGFSVIVLILFLAYGMGSITSLSKSEKQLEELSQEVKPMLEQLSEKEQRLESLLKNLNE